MYLSNIRSTDECLDFWKQVKLSYTQVKMLQTNFCKALPIISYGLSGLSQKILVPTSN